MTTQSHETELRTEYGEWLSQYDWSHFATLTPLHPTSPDALLRSVKGWIGRAEYRLGHPLNWFIIAERGGYGRLHAHALLGGARDVPCDELRKGWVGLTAIAPYEAGAGAPYYLSKEIGRSTEVAYDCSDTFPPFQ